MIARINLPGSSYHRWVRGTKTECIAWLNAQQERNPDRQEYWYPQSLLTEREALAIRYRDGQHVYPRGYTEGE